MCSPRVLGVAALTALGGVLRFATLDVQSFSGDEGVTWGLLQLPLRDLVETIPDSENIPHPYYLLAWGWSKLFGDGEVGLRSLSALCGTATIPVAYAGAARLVSPRAAFVAAALVATHPFLIWYSQEARSYALLVLLAALSLLFFARALDAGDRRAVVAWAVCAAAALATHYHAVFFIAPEAVVLYVLGRNRRDTALAIGGVAAVGAALMPLALKQRSLGNFEEWIEESTLADRLKEVPRKLLLGEQGTPGDYGGFAEALLPVALLCAAAGIALLLLKADREERRGALLAAAVAAGIIGIPLVMALVGEDVFAAYLLVTAVVPLAIAGAGGYGAHRAGAVGIAPAVLLSAVFLAVSIYAATSLTLQRPDFRESARALGDAHGARAIVITPDNGYAPLRAYTDDLELMPASGASVSEIVLLGMRSEDESFRTRSGAAAGPPRPAPGFAEVERRDTDRFTLVRFRATRAVPVDAERLAASRLGDVAATVAVQR
jgi:mannosyltransferase